MTTFTGDHMNFYLSGQTNPINSDELIGNHSTLTLNGTVNDASVLGSRDTLNLNNGNQLANVHGSFDITKLSWAKNAMAFISGKHDTVFVNGATHAKITLETGTTPGSAKAQNAHITIGPLVGPGGINDVIVHPLRCQARPDYLGSQVRSDQSRCLGGWPILGWSWRNDVLCAGTEARLRGRVACCA